jgi:hypothetical protein
MSLFGDKKEIKSLAALKGVAAADITADQIAAINEEFSAMGLAGIEVSVAGSVASLTSAVETASADAQAAAEQAAEELSSANERITALEADLAEANTRLGQPAATAEEVVIEADKITADGSKNEADEKITAELKAKYGL